MKNQTFTLKDKIFLGIIAALAIVLLFSFKSCSSKDSELQISRQNMAAQQEKTRKTENLIGQMQYEKAVFMGDIERLKGLNQDLSKELENQKGNVRVITKVVTKIVFDTIVVENRVNRLDDSSFVIGLNYRKDYDSSNGISFKGEVPVKVKKINEAYTLESSSSKISDLGLKMKIYTGLSEEDGIYRIFAKTDFPGVAFDLDGAIVDPEKSFADKGREYFTVVLGGGIGYGATTTGLGIFPSVGVYIGLNLFKF